MTFLHPALLLGLGLVAVPVVLHLLLRPRPKRLVFPALRLLQQRQQQNVRRLRLRQLWLLLLRMAVVAAMVFALSRPSLPAANYALTTSEIAKLAAIIALGLAAYFAVMIWWERQSLPRHVWLTRRTMLRGGVGAGTLLLILLWLVLPYSRRIAADITAPASPVSDNIPVAAVFLCDTSPSMAYQFEGVTRLEAARRIVARHLQTLPVGSKAAVMDLANDTPTVFTPDLTAVQNRLAALTVQPLTPALNERLRAAVRFHNDDRQRTLSEQGSVAEDRRQDRFIREVYLLTDLTKSAWHQDSAHTLREDLLAAPWLGVYLIDVGIEQPVNSGVVDVKLSRPAVPPEGQLHITAAITALGTLKPEQNVELWVQGVEGKSMKRDQQTIALPATGVAEATFALDVLQGPYVQGEVRLVTSDPLSFDNTGFFTVRVLPPLEVLVVAERGEQADLWLEALAALNKTGTSYRPTFVRAAALSDVDLSKFELVCLINVASPSAELWEKLGAYVMNGGGVAVFLGDRSAVTSGVQREGIDPVAYNSASAQKWLPAQLKAALTFSPAQQLDFRDSSHPFTQRLERFGVLSELGDIDFYRYWKVTPHDSALVLSRWNDDGAQAAIMLRSVGRGRALLFASSVDSMAWNELPRNWSFLVLADQMLQLLSRQAASPHTLRIGDPVVLPLSQPAPSAAALLRLPDFTQRPVDLNPDTRDLQLPATSQPGHYQVVPQGAPTSSWLAAFSANPLPPESDLTRLTTDHLDDLLGSKRYGLARDPEQLSRSVHAGRLGQEMYGLLMVVLLIAFAWEQFAAAWFYKADEKPTPNR